AQSARVVLPLRPDFRIFPRVRYAPGGAPLCAAPPSQVGCGTSAAYACALFAAPFAFGKRVPKKCFLLALSIVPRRPPKGGAFRFIYATADVYSDPAHGTVCSARLGYSALTGARRLISECQGEAEKQLATRSSGVAPRKGREPRSL